MNINEILSPAMKVPIKKSANVNLISKIQKDAARNSRSKLSKQKNMNSQSGPNMNAIIHNIAPT
jgi:hypothetical protein